ncbi:MAG: 50S ribosome-binding GTPase [Candidatus Micrarchaeota archaeon]|nr:50S ribosome-binding GTPase [Candidatus Micrarchaeota archaeon]
MKRDEVKRSARKAGTGFDVRKSGDASVALVGFPSVGKSTILNKITNAESRTAAYAFTTISVVPGMMEYEGAKIQVLDLPGVLEGAGTGVGRGREVIAVARGSDLALILLDVFTPDPAPIRRELEAAGIRLDKEPPNVVITEKKKGGITVNSTVKLKGIDERMVREVLGVYGVHNADVIFHENMDTERFIDAVVGSRKYIPSLTVLNKVDLVDARYVSELRKKFDFIAMSAEGGKGIEELKRSIYGKLKLIRIYTKPRMGEADLKEPMMIRNGSNVGDICDKLHRDMRSNFKYAQIWGPSAKFGGQKVGLKHIMKDGDVIFIAVK